MPWTVEWRVFVDGQDLTSALRPYLMRISVSDKAGSASDACTLEVDDAGGQVKLPAEGSLVQVYLQGTSVFTGKVSTVHSSGSRGGGRTLSVTAKGFDAKGKVKEPQSHHLDDGTLQQFLDKVASKAGLSSIKIDPAFASLVRPYWSASGESLLHIGQKLARELGGTFKIRGDQAVLVKRGQGINAVGGAMPTVVGEVGRNVISWAISPLSGRGKFAKSKVRYFDRKTASFKEIEVETGIEADATDDVQTLAADEEQAKAIAEGRRTESERDGGEGTVELDLEATAQAEGTFILSGARPGVDGTYRIEGVTHKADRGGGSTTSLDLKQPTGSAGKDERKPGQDPAGSGPSGEAANGGAGAAGAASASYPDYNRRYGRTDEN